MFTLLALTCSSRALESRLFHFSPWTIFLYTNNYLRDFASRCKDSPRILGLRPLAPHHPEAANSRWLNLLFVGAQHAVPGANAWLPVRHPPRVNGRAHVECGSLLPLFAVRALPGRAPRIRHILDRTCSSPLATPSAAPPLHLSGFTHESGALLQRDRLTILQHAIRKNGRKADDDESP